MKSYTMRKETKIAHLSWSQVCKVDEYGEAKKYYNQVVRMTNPIVNGHPMGYGWYDMPHEIVLSPQEYADKIGEVVFYTDSYGKSGYAYPKETGGKGGGKK